VALTKDRDSPEPGVEFVQLFADGDQRSRFTEPDDSTDSRGDRVILVTDGVPVADVVPRERRSRWLHGAELREQLRNRAADAPLTAELFDLVGQSIGEI
jgi:hypothetical protein